MTTLRSVLGLLCASSMAIVGCASGFEEDGETAVVAEQELKSGAAPCAHHRVSHHRQHHRGHVRFGVISDPHLYDTSLGDTGAAFEAELQSDRKMLRESQEILDTVVNSLIEAHPEFVLVSGDMTKDGELVNHELFTRALARLERAGIEAFVVPGNHDLLNGHARRYDGTEAEPVATATEADFLRMYRRFGYGQAILRDASTLSYVAQVADGLWLLALDSTRHQENVSGEEPVTAGRLSAETRAWALEAAKLAAARGKRMIAMMHHGLIEHFGGQSILFPDYLIEDRASLARDFADVGIHLVFTGHYHAQDIVTTRFEDGSQITDVETGALVTYPSSYRIVDFDLKHEVAAVKSHPTTELPSMPAFASYAAKDLDLAIETDVTEALTNAALFEPAQIQALLPAFVTSFAGLFAGDEPPADQATLDVAAALAGTGTELGQLYASVLLSLHNDASPADNNVVLMLRDARH